MQLAGFACDDTPRAVFPSFDEARGDSTGAVLIRGVLPVVVATGALGQTAPITVDSPGAVLGQGRSDFLS